MKKKSFLLFGLLLCLVATLLACGASDGATTSNTGTLATSATAVATKPAQHFKVGQTVSVGGTWKTTVDEIKTSEGADFVTPAADHHILLVTVTVENISTKELVISSILNFKLKDADGSAYTVTIYPGVTAPDGKVEPGDKTKGTLAYEVPTSAKKFTLAFESDILAGGQTIWDLSI